MKRRLSVVFIILVVMAIFASTAFAAPAQSSKSVTLVSVEYQEGGMVLMFHTSGLTKNDLNNNSFYAHSNYYNMYCKFIDDTTDVRCTLSKKLAKFQGESFHVILVGFGFYDVFPTDNYCPDEEIPWVYYNTFYYGELAYSSDVVPLKLWNEAITSGAFDYYAQTYGVTYEMQGQFCSSAELLPPT